MREFSLVANHLRIWMNGGQGNCFIKNDDVMKINEVQNSLYFYNKDILLRSAVT